MSKLKQFAIALTLAILILAIYAWPEVVGTLTALTLGIWLALAAWSRFRWKAVIVPVAALVISAMIFGVVAYSNRDPDALQKAQAASDAITQQELEYSRHNGDFTIYYHLYGGNIHEAPKTDFEDEFVNNMAQANAANPKFALYAGAANDDMSSPNPWYMRVYSKPGYHGQVTWKLWRLKLDGSVDRQELHETLPSEIGPAVALILAGLPYNVADNADQTTGPCVPDCASDPHAYAQGCAPNRGC